MACASWWGLRGCSDRPVTLATTGASRRTTDFAVVRRVRHLPPRWVVPLRGVPTLRPEYLAIHLFADCRFERAEVLVDRLWSMRLLSGPSIELALNDLGRSGRNGIVGARQYLERRPPGYIPTATGLEGRVKRLLEEHGITLRSQIDSGAEMWTGRVDFRHDTVPFVLEVQSEAFHSALTDVEHDERRHQRLVADGFTYREVWDTAVWAQPNVVVDTVRDGIAEALGAL
jgi:very-short-patch-repair endonuclease